jgi:hypothetical protein
LPESPVAANSTVEVGEKDDDAVEVSSLDRKTFLKLEQALYFKLCSISKGKSPLAFFRKFDNTGSGCLSRNRFCAAVVSATGLVLLPIEINCFMSKYKKFVSNDPQQQFINYESYIKYCEAKAVLEPQTLSLTSDQFSHLMATRGVVSGVHLESLLTQLVAPKDAKTANFNKGLALVRARIWERSGKNQHLHKLYKTMQSDLYGGNTQNKKLSLARVVQELIRLGFPPKSGLTTDELQTFVGQYCVTQANFFSFGEFRALLVDPQWDLSPMSLSVTASAHDPGNSISSAGGNVSNTTLMTPDNQSEESGRSPFAYPLARAGVIHSQFVNTKSTPGKTSSSSQINKYASISSVSLSNSAVSADPATAGSISSCYSSSSNNSHAMATTGQSGLILNQTIAADAGAELPRRLGHALTGQVVRGPAFVDPARVGTPAGAAATGKTQDNMPWMETGVSPDARMLRQLSPILTSLGSESTRASFRLLDLNGDGVIDIDEILALFESRGLHTSLSRSPILRAYVGSFCQRTSGRFVYEDYHRLLASGRATSSLSPPTPNGPGSSASLLAPVLEVPVSSDMRLVVDLIARHVRDRQLSVLTACSSLDQAGIGIYLCLLLFEHVSYLCWDVQARRC